MARARPLPLRLAWAAWTLLGAACSAPATLAPPPASPPRPAPPLAAPLAAPGPRAPAAAPVPAVAPPAAAELARPEPAGSGPSARAPIGEVAGEPLYAEDLLVEWYDVASRELWLVVDQMVAMRLALAEAQRLGLRLDPALVERRATAERQEIEAELRAKDDARQLDEFVRTELGQDPARWQERLRARTIRQLLAERAVRAWTLSNENLALRLIVLAESEAAAECLELLAGGADFAALAGERSVDDTRRGGGLLPYLVRQEHSPLARVAFATPVGEVGGPVPVSGHFVILRVEERRPALEGDWRAIGPAVERSLAEHPLRDAEFLHWKIEMERRYPADLAPLDALLGTDGG